MFDNDIIAVTGLDKNVYINKLRNNLLIKIFPNFIVIKK